MKKSKLLSIMLSVANNSVENIEFGAMQTGNYTIVVNKVPNSYTGNVEYGLAWMEAY